MKLLRFSSPDSIATPSASLLEQLPETIAKPAKETSDFRERYLAATRDLFEAEHARDAARLSDAELAGAALRANKPAPKPTLPKAQEKVLEQGAALEALGVAAEAAGRDLRKAVEAHGAAHTVKLEEAQARQRAKCHEAALALADTVGEGGATAALISWLKTPYNAPNPAAHRGQLTGLRGMNGDPLSVSVLVAELATAFTPEVPRPARVVKPLPPLERAEAA